MKQVTPTAPRVDGTTTSSGLYPELPDDGAEPGQYFRLQEVSLLRKQLEDEREHRSRLYKKYRRGVNAADAVDTALLSASVGMGVGGVGLLTTIVAAPVVVGLEAAALGCGLLGVACKYIGRRLAVKAKKHAEILVLAESKYRTVMRQGSKALTDGKISDEEFRLLLNEVLTYDQMKEEIRSRSKKAHSAVALDDSTKNALIQQGRDEARASLIKRLAAP